MNIADNNHIFTQIAIPDVMRLSEVIRVPFSPFDNFAVAFFVAVIASRVFDYIVFINLFTILIFKSIVTWALIR